MVPGIWAHWKYTYFIQMCTDQNLHELHRATLQQWWRYNNYSYWCYWYIIISCFEHPCLCTLFQLCLSCWDDNACDTACIQPITALERYSLAQNFRLLLLWFSLKNNNISEETDCRHMPSRRSGAIWEWWRAYCCFSPSDNLYNFPSLISHAFP